MFERFTESARRAIFFARHNAASYGSPMIETEHLLLGLLREHPGKNWFPSHSNVATVEPRIRAEIERRITRGKAIATSVEIPLSAECKRILVLASDASDRLGHRAVEAEHILIAILQLPGCMAAQILKTYELEPQSLPGKSLAEAAAPAVVSTDRPAPDRPAPDPFALLALNNFLQGLKSLDVSDSRQFFSPRARFIDASGRCWTSDEIFSTPASPGAPQVTPHLGPNSALLFAPYAKKNAAYTLDEPLVATDSLLVANILWQNVSVPALPSAAPSAIADPAAASTPAVRHQQIHRMTITFAFDATGWLIHAIQITPILPAPPRST